MSAAHDVAIAFDAPRLAAMLDEMHEMQIDALPFGVIHVDVEGRVRRYSRREAELSGRGARVTVGLHFFRELAPCMDSPAFRGRIEAAIAAGTLDVRLSHVGDFADRGRALDVRALSARAGGFWLCLRRIAMTR